MVEAVGRLLPGVIGNAESLVEESHEDGLLEYPVYTSPAPGTTGTARGAAVLLSGNHAAIAAWRHEQRSAHGRAPPRPAPPPSGGALADLEVRLAAPPTCRSSRPPRACWAGGPVRAGSPLDEHSRTSQGPRGLDGVRRARGIRGPRGGGRLVASVRGRCVRRPAGGRPLG